MAVDLQDPVPAAQGRGHDPGLALAAADAALVASLRAGDADAFATIVRAWSPAMLRVARRFVPTDASAQDVVQETWVAVIRGLSRFEERSLLRTWVFSILANLGRRRGVSDHRVLPMSSLGARTESRAPVDPDRFRPEGERWAGVWREEAAPRSWGPEANVLTVEVRDLIIRALTTLPPRQREVVVLRDIQGLSAEEVGRMLGLAPGNVRVLLHRGRLRLREALEDYYHERPQLPVGAREVVG